jgi:hypothetical protein
MKRICISKGTPSKDHVHLSFQTQTKESHNRLVRHCTITHHTSIQLVQNKNFHASHFYSLFFHVKLKLNHCQTGQMLSHYSRSPPVQLLHQNATVSEQRHTVRASTHVLESSHHLSNHSGSGRRH